MKTHWEKDKTYWEKEQDVAGDGGHTEIEQHFSGTNLFVLAPRDRHSTVQHTYRNNVEKWMWTWTAGGDQDHQKCPKPSNPFPEGTGRTNCT